jgi:metal-dependent amidase/aminoacylase/carboxypeptidase family protein
VVIAARIVLGLQTIVSRENNPVDPAVITVGSIHAAAPPHHPDQVKLQITVRSLDPAVHKRLLAAIERQANGEAMAAGAPKEPLIETRSGTDAVYNDPELTRRVVAAARAARQVRRVQMPADGRKTLAIRTGGRARRVAACRRGRCGEAGSLAQVRRAGPWGALAVVGAGARAHDQGSDGDTSVQGMC